MLKKFLINFLLIIFGICLSLFVLEIGVRLYFLKSIRYSPYQGEFYQYDGALGWSLAPNRSSTRQRLDYVSYVKTNSKGFRDIEHDDNKKDDVFRILILGDSFMEAYQVPLEKSFCRLLEQKLNLKQKGKFEVINTGVSAYGTAQEYLFLKERGVKYWPDLIILAFLPVNDTMDNSQTLSTIVWGSNTINTLARPFFKLDAEKNLIFEPLDQITAKESIENIHLEYRDIENSKKWYEKFLLYTIIKNRIERLNYVKTPRYDINGVYGIYATEESGDWKEAEEISQKLILEINREANKVGAGFMFFSVTDVIQFNEDFKNRVITAFSTLGKTLDFKQPERNLIKFADENNLNFLSLEQPFEEYSKKTRYSLHFQWEDNHWNIRGHELAADLIYHYLIDKKLVPIN